MFFDPSDKVKEFDFAEILKKSICLEQSTQAWCENCEKYQPTVRPASPPLNRSSGSSSCLCLARCNCAFCTASGADSQHPMPP